MKLLNMKDKNIKEAVKNGKLTIAVIGLGRVGLPTALLFAEAGAKVIGVDIDSQRITDLKRGNAYINEPGLETLLQETLKNGTFTPTTDPVNAMSQSDAVIVCVPTPLDETKKPDYSSLRNACENVARNLKLGIMVMIESTVSPGTTEKLVAPILERFSGLKIARDFGLAFCPERGAPGAILHDLKYNTRVTGGIDENSTRIAHTLLKTITQAAVLKVSNTTTAEATKIFENIYRDVNIALANELAVLCEKLEVDLLEIIDAANTKTLGFVDKATQKYRSFSLPCNLHTPGAGVGGDCIPVNPYYLLEKAEPLQVDLPLVKTARRTNDAMPYHVTQLVIDALKEAGKTTSGSRIAILGFTYKGDVDDLRNTPAKPIINKLKKLGASLIGFDPMIGTKQVKEFQITQTARLNDCLKNADCAVIITDHSEFKNIELAKIKKLMNEPVIVDARGILDAEESIKTGFVYRGVGRGIAAFTKKPSAQVQLESADQHER